MKELRESQRELEVVAEDRENRLARMEQSCTALMAQLESTEKERDSLRVKYEFQVEVSQRVARHYRTLKNASSQFESISSNLDTLIGQVRQTFMHTEHKVGSLQHLKAKMTELLATKRELLESKESALRTLELETGKLRIDLGVSIARSKELQSHLDNERAISAERNAQMKEYAKDNSALSDLLIQQSALLEREQLTSRSLFEELNQERTRKSQADASMKGDGSLVPDAADAADAKVHESNSPEMRAKMTIMEIQLEEIAKKRADAAQQHKQLVDSLLSQRDEAYASLGTVEKRIIELEKENGDLRTLLAKRKSNNAGVAQKTMSSSDWQSNSRQFFPQSMVTSVPLPTHTPRQILPPKTFPANSCNSRNEDSIVVDDVSDLGDSFTTEGAAPTPFASPGGSHHSRGPIAVLQRGNTLEDSRELDLLGDVSPDLFQYRGLKCCGEPAAGLCISCHKCHETFHVRCAEAQRSKPIPKKRFLCLVCDPKALLSPKSKKSRLQLQ